MVFANGNGRYDWGWSAVKAIPDEEKEFKMDMTTLSNYKERDFMDALSYIGVLPE